MNSPKRRKTGGRKAGTPNRVTADLRQVLKEAVDGYHASGLAASDLENMTPKERLGVVIKMLVYIVPRPQAVTIDLNRPAVNDDFIEALNRLSQEPED